MSNNPKRIPVFPSIYTAETTSMTTSTSTTSDPVIEGMTPATAGGPAPAPAPAPLAQETVKSLLDKRKQKFIDAHKAPSTSPGAADILKKITVNNVNQEIESLLDKLDSLTTTDLSQMFDSTETNTKLESGASDLDTKKVVNQVNSAITQVTRVFRAILRKGVLLTRLGVKKTQSFMLSWNDNVNSACRKIAGVLTNNHATDYEIQVFVDQAQKFCMAFLIWIFVMNWYFVTFFIKEDQRFTFDPVHLKNFSITLYAFFGPSYRALNCFNWAIVEVPSMLRYTLTKTVIFCIMLVIFTALVQANFHTTILNDFFNSMEGRYSTSVFCVFAILIVLAYALWFVAQESKWHEWLNVFKNIPGTVLYFFVVLIYLIVVCSVGIPLAMFFVSAFFVIYSFLGVYIYRGADTMNTFVRISEDISNLSEVVADEADSYLGTQPFDFLKMPTYLWNAFYRTLRIAYGYAFELILLFILLTGISKYRGAFHKVISSKLNANQTFAKNGPVSDAFKNLFTWLLIINIFLVIVIVVWMIKKWNTIQMLKCATDVKLTAASNYLDMFKKAKDFVGKTATETLQESLTDRGIARTDEEREEYRQENAVLERAEANPNSAFLQQRAQAIRDNRTQNRQAVLEGIQQKYDTETWNPLTNLAKDSENLAKDYAPLFSRPPPTSSK